MLVLRAAFYVARLLKWSPHATYPRSRVVQACIPIQEFRGYPSCQTSAVLLDAIIVGNMRVLCDWIQLLFYHREWQFFVFMSAALPLNAEIASSLVMVSAPAFISIVH